MKGHWIENKWVLGKSQETIAVHNPATEEVLEQVPSGTEADVHRAVESAKAAFEIWRKTPAIDRANLLHEASAKMRANWAELVELLTLEEGKPVSENEEELEGIAGTIWINDPLTDNYAGPFGGMKMNGNARELGLEGLDSFLETKHVHWDFSPEAKDWWYPY